MGRHSDPKESHLLISGEASNFDELAMRQVFVAPIELVNALIGPDSATIVNSAVTFERTVVD
ncbi:MAG: hypothetical protein AAF974_05835, partial [Cyanobacteria bacterium P01_E01_bin.34]